MRTQELESDSARTSVQEHYGQVATRGGGGLVLGSLGMLTPIVAIIFQEAGCISVVLSSALLLWAQPKRPTTGSLPNAGMPRTSPALTS